jgi:heme a synthase
MQEHFTPGIDSGVWLHRFAVLVAISTFLLIIAGALVTGNEAGLSVPDWPLSYGTWMPPMVGGIFYEHGHRMIATLVGFLTTVLALWLLKKESRRSVRKLGLIALAAIIAQGVLGGITVLFFLPTVISVLHACLAQAFFCIVVSLAWVTSNPWKGDKLSTFKNQENSLLRRLCVLTTASIYMQLILGAALRHSKSGVILHVLGALVVTFFLIWVVATIYKSYLNASSLFHTAVVLSGLLVVQLFLGLGSYLVRLAAREDVQPALSTVTITTAHVAVGALALATSLILTLQSYRVLSRSGLAVYYSSAPQKAAI